MHKSLPQKGLIIQYKVVMMRRDDLRRWESSSYNSQLVSNSIQGLCMNVSGRKLVPFPVQLILTYSQDFARRVKINKGSHREI